MQSMPFASAGAGQHCAPTMGNKMALLKQPGLELYLINEALAIKGQVRECVMVTERDALKGVSLHIRCHAYISPIVINFPIDVSAHAQ